MDFFTTIEISGFPLWVVLLICCGVFLASFMDSIAGGGGIISVPTYLMAFSGLPTYYALATNKLSSFVGLIVSSGRFIKNGYVNWRLAVPSMAIAVLCARFGTKLQHLIDEKRLTEKMGQYERKIGSNKAEFVINNILGYQNNLGWEHHGADHAHKPEVAPFIANPGKSIGNTG